MKRRWIGIAYASLVVASTPGCFGGAFSKDNIRPDAAVPTIAAPAAGKTLEGESVVLAPGFKPGQR